MPSTRVTIFNNLSSNHNIESVCNNANNNTAFLRRNLWSHEAAPTPVQDLILPHHRLQRIALSDYNRDMGPTARGRHRYHSHVLGVLQDQDPGICLNAMNNMLNTEFQFSIYPVYMEGIQLEYDNCSRFSCSDYQ